jgi:hypothetical protein
MLAESKHFPAGRKRIEACYKMLQETADWPKKSLSLAPHWFVKGIPFASFIGSHLATNES